MPRFPTPFQNTRIGFHYYPDILHFRESDLTTWIPLLNSMGVNWLTLQSPGDRTIPEYFIKGVISSGIEPILHFNLPLAASTNIEDLKLLFEIYGKWGAHYVVLFDRPNRRASWPTALWAQNALVDRFLDRYLPIAELSLKFGLIPVFTPLTPGGDYWDTAFLRDALQSIDRRGNTRILENLVLGAYAIAGDRTLNWGRGGPERWPSARPYQNSLEYEDHRGLYIHDWYTTIAESIIGNISPVILFGITSQPIHSKNQLIQDNQHIKKTLAIAQALIGSNASKSNIAILHAKIEGVDAFPTNVLAGNFWLLTTDYGSPHENHAWIHSDGSVDQKVDTLRQWIAGLSIPVAQQNAKSNPLPTADHPIQHYLLLPAYDWGISDWHLNAIRPFIHKHQPTIGFSIKEAILASRVTIVGDSEQFPEQYLESLRSAGCVVDRIDGDGMSIATQLSER